MQNGISRASLDTGRRLFELTTLHEICRHLRLADDPIPLTFDLLTSIIGLTGARWGLLWLRTDGNGSLSLVHLCGLERSPVLSFPLTPVWSEVLTRSRGPLRFDGAGPAAATPSLPEELDRLDPSLLLPLVAGGRLNGLIALGRNFLERDLDPSLLDLLEETAYLTALVLDRLPLPTVAGMEGSVPSGVDLWRSHPPLGRIAGESRAVRELHRHLVTVAATSCTVLLEGETGTGKQLVAEVLHELGPRQGAPFIEVDCGAVPENLIESELFGHARGAFTGADRDRKGVFELAHGGTLFLDEVGNIPWSVQGRLLRVLQERRFRPVGGSRSLAVDVRVVAATNGDLRAAVRDGRFREDLFYRLYVYPVRVPPLRERREDIRLLTGQFLQDWASENGLTAPTPTAGFFERLDVYGFPGNVRELRHILERCVLRSEGPFLEASLLEELDALPPAPVPGTGRHRSSASPGRPDPAATAQQTTVTRGGLGGWVVDVLRRHGFNVKAAAHALEQQARQDPYTAPPVTDRGTLTAYLQGESLRLFAESGGDLDRVVDRLSAGDRRLAGTLYTRVRRYIGTALDAAWSAAGSDDEAAAAVRERYAKLPSAYGEVLDRVARFALRNGPAGPSSSDRDRTTGVPAPGWRSPLELPPDMMGA